MSDYTIFYSWQTDTPSECCRNLIRKSLDHAVEQINLNVDIDEAPRVDSGMEGVAGSPDVASVMFEKIGESSIFLGDATLVGSIGGNEISANSPPKRTINPNVAIEMGLAAGLLGWERIICVMNEYYGKRTEMPFDVRNRRFPIDFKLSPEDAKDEEKRLAVIGNLTGWITKAITAVDEQFLRKVNVAIKQLDIRCLNVMMRHMDNIFFSVPDSSQDPFVDAEKFNAASIRLIELGLLCADIQDGSRYAYHWTYLGKKVLDKTVRISKSKMASFA